MPPDSGGQKTLRREGWCHWGVEFGKFDEERGPKTKEVKTTLLSTVLESSSLA
jgi:hypothetical protein